jgi:hypothetical protein
MHIFLMGKVHIILDSVAYMQAHIQFLCGGWYNMAIIFPTYEFEP